MTDIITQAREATPGGILLLNVYRDATKRVMDTIRQTEAATDYGAQESTPTGLRAGPILSIERVALEVAELATAITGGAYDLPGALQALGAIAERAEAIRLVARQEAFQGTFYMTPARGRA
jgi:hypothetical protein